MMLLKILLSLALLLLSMTEGHSAPPPPANQGDVFLCAACPVVEAYVIGGLTLAENITTRISGSLQQLIGVVLAVWVLFSVSKLFSPFGTMDRSSKILQDVFARTGTAIVVVVALSPAATRVYQNFIFYPLISATVDASEGILKAAQNITGTSNPYVCSLPDSADPKKEMATSISCQTDYVTRVIWRGLEIGLRSLSMGLVKTDSNGNTVPESKNFWEATGNFFKKLYSAAKGTLDIVAEGPVEWLLRALLRVAQVMVVVGTFAYAWAFYPLYMLNVVVKWAMISVMWPILAASMIFPSTRSTGIAALKGAFHASLTMIFLATSAGIMLSILEPMFAQMDRSGLLAIDASGDKANSFDMQDGRYWTIVITAFVMVHMMKKSASLATTFTGSKMDTELADGIWSILKKVAWVTTGGISSGLSAGIQAVKAVSKK